MPKTNPHAKSKGQKEVHGRGVGATRARGGESIRAPARVKAPGVDIVRIREALIRQQVVARAPVPKARSRSVTIGANNPPSPTPGANGAVLPPHAHMKRPNCVAVALDGSAVTTGDDRQVRRWEAADLAAGRTDNPRRIKRHRKRASYVVVSGDDRVFSASFDGTVDVSPLRGRGPRFTFEGHKPPRGKTPEVWVVAVSADGSRGLSATNKGEILLWDTRPPGTVIAPMQFSDEQVAALAFVPGANKFLSGHADGTMVLWDIGDETNPVPIDLFTHANSHQVNSIAVTSDGSTAVTASFDMGMNVWDLGAKDPARKLKRIILGHTDLVWRVAVSPRDDTKIASASEDGTVRLWDIRSGRELLAKPFKPGHHGVMGVAFSRDGRRLLYTGDGTGNEIFIGDLP
jgi:WD40 repeat protein